MILFICDYCKKEYKSQIDKENGYFLLIYPIGEKEAYLERIKVDNEPCPKCKKL